MKVIQTLCFTD